MEGDKRTQSVPLDTGDGKEEVIKQQNVGAGVERGGGEYPEPATPSQSPAPGAAPMPGDHNSDGTITEAIDEYEAQGFTGQFAPDTEGYLRCLTCDQRVHADEATVAELRRVEGVSDPDDMAAIAALQCPRCDAKGTVVLKYGPLASIEESDVLRLLEKRHRPA